MTVRLLSCSSGNLLVQREPNLVHGKTSRAIEGSGQSITASMISVRDVASQGAVRGISSECFRAKISRQSWTATGRHSLSVRHCLYFTGSASLVLSASPHKVKQSLQPRNAMADIFKLREKTELKLEREHVLTEDQLNKAKSALDRFIRSVATNPERREGAYPYYLLHKPGEKVYGTVLFFHGFSNRPDQMWRLAQYLFDNGFNVYQPAIYNHYLVNPDKNWAQVDLKPRWKGPIRERFLKDPVLKGVLDRLGTVSNVTKDQMNQILERVYTLSPDMDDIVDAINDGDNTAAFEKYYDSTHLKYVEDAEARLKECESLPGPAFTIGLSVGGAVALGLAAHRPDKIAKVVAYAPLLKQIGEVTRQATLIAGPLDVKQSGWDPSLQFTVGCFAASDLFGNHVLKEADKLAPVPTFLMLTENDDSADIPTNKKFIAQLRSLAGRSGVPHLEGMYTAEMRVPHPMVDPVEVSQGMKNKYWASLYQETFRFLTEGRVDEEHLKGVSQDPALPQVPPV